MAGKYDKIELIGSGTFGKAWLVKKEDSRKKCIIKEILVRGMSEKHKKQALTEVEVLAKCKHLNIVRYREAFVDQGFLSIVMEYAENGDLQSKIDNQKGIYFGSQLILDWFVQICFGLRYIHGLNILHRDLKTQNIFLNQDNIIKIGDFGISRMLTSTSDCAITTIGTPYYLSPEICQKKPYNNKSDMWALGCVLYNLVTLHQPFEASNVSLLMVKILNATYDQIPSNFVPLLGDLIAVLLKVEALYRPTASEVLCIPALQPYINVYIKKSLALREQHKQFTPSPAVKKFTEQRLIKGKKVTSSEVRNYSSPDDNKENIDPKGVKSEPRLWLTPKSSVLKEVNSNVKSESPVRKRAKITPVTGSPKLSLHRTVLQKLQKRDKSTLSGSSRLIGKTYTVKSSDSPRTTPREFQGESTFNNREISKLIFDSIISSHLDIKKKAFKLKAQLRQHLGIEKFGIVCSDIRHSFSQDAGFEDATAHFDDEVMLHFPVILQYLQLENINNLVSDMNDE